MIETRAIPLAQLVEPPEPVRAQMDTAKLEELASSIRRLGLIQPIVVIPATGVQGRGDSADAPAGSNADTPALPLFEIVAGHRRFLAARMAGLREVECRVYADEQVAKEAIMLHENTCREDLSAAEEGWLFCEIAARDGMTEAQLCELTGHVPQYVYERMDLVRKDEEVAKANARREINFAVAKALNKCKDEPHRRYLLQLAVQSGATARVVMGWIQQHDAVQMAAPPPPPAAGAPPIEPAPPENVLKCFLCDQEHRPELLRSVFLCYTEMPFIKEVAKKLAETAGT